MTHQNSAVAIRSSIALLFGGTVLGGISCRSDDIQAPTEPATTAEAAVTGELLFRQVAAGLSHTCAVAIDNRAYCWGWNVYGQLGDGTTTVSRPTPKPMIGGVSFIEVSAGVRHSCGLSLDHRIYCWGDNNEGQLGDGTRTPRLMPVRVATGLLFRQVRAGSFHTCALTNDKRAYCWGRNSSGELGTGGSSALKPAAVAGGLHFFQISAGNTHSCGKTTDFRGFCWGANDFGKLGDGTTTDRRTPRAVVGGHQFYGLSAGNDHTCGLTSINTVYCWGWNGGGAIGDGINFFQRLTPTKVIGGQFYRQAVAGTMTSCGLTRSSRAYCWGLNGTGQVGDGTTTNRFSPVAVTGGIQFNAAVGVTAGARHVCGLGADQRVYCWGFNGNGELGDGTFTDRYTPVLVGEGT